MALDDGGWDGEKSPRLKLKIWRRGGGSDSTFAIVSRVTGARLEVTDAAGQ